jgi:hypothetical protein
MDENRFSNDRVMEIIMTIFAAVTIIFLFTKIMFF